ncbi:MAG TPA: 2-hydroxyacyl-CoA dehydratase family protein [Intrasporangium sp.]|uniref:2-hydroxyacyl-CoA dehydratase subunit D n=1 Tax=Intrasporangium sp. TaxID=1925024 RepID=UPI002D771BBB|nr:2-hydroxyacyl-CoA dehydratase family protein [Intrasporangium sp.]HET7399871.1 2-hydroxyacyl-CoA dehydratase family protein [Intrasporangium sp.]
MTSPLNRLTEVAADPDRYVAEWKQAHPGRQVAGVLPMNFPEELLHSAGFLPVVIQENNDPDTHGRAILAEFYCGYTRNLADQAAKGKLGIYDAYFVADHCVQLLGAADVMRFTSPQTPIYFGQFIASMSEPSTRVKVRTELDRIVAEVERSAGGPVDPDRLAESIRLYNRDRMLLREVFDARRRGRLHLPSKDVQSLVKSSMVMDKAEHVALLEQLLTEGIESRDPHARVRLHLSGHFCHAPKRELLELIEDCGAEIVDDDLYHGRRYITTDVREDLDPVDALAEWYFDRNVNVPCPTRVQHDADWDTYLRDAVGESGADGVVILMAKFCEPHMLLYPELRTMMDERQIPYLLIETEHEGLPLESIRTRVEALVERISRRTRIPAAV